MILINPSPISDLNSFSYTSESSSTDPELITQKLSALSYPICGILPISGIHLENLNSKIFFETPKEALYSIATYLINHPTSLENIAYLLCNTLQTLHKNTIYPVVFTEESLRYHIKTEAFYFFDVLNTTQLRPLNVQDPTTTPKNWLPYLAPEQFGRTSQTSDYRANFYSLGILLYKLSTHQFPFNNTDPIEIMHQHLAQKPMPPHEINKDTPIMFSNLILKLLEKNPSERYQTLEGIIYDIKKIAATNSLFILGEKDTLQNLLIPKKLYGRDLLIKKLESRIKTLQNNTGPAHHTTLLHGNSGIGKTVIVTQLKTAVQELGGQVYSGKCETFQRNIPAFPWIRAIQNAIVKIIQNPTKNDPRIETFIELIHTQTGLIEYIPELASFLTKKTNTPSETIKIKDIVIQFFHLATAHSTLPILVSIEDLQWADSKTLLILEDLIKHPITNLYIIGTYRDEEVASTHPLKKTIEEIFYQTPYFESISIPPLTSSAIEELLHDLLHDTAQNIDTLSTLLIRRTDGNPFYVVQLLRNLYETNLLQLDLSSFQWNWDIEAIKKIDIPTSVATFLSNKIQTFPKNTQKMLQIASCYGAQFSIHDLMKISKLSQEDCQTYLAPAHEVGLIEQLSLNESHTKENILTFTHDQIINAAYSPINDHEKQRLHFGIALAQYQTNLHTHSHQNLIKMVDHFNAGPEIPPDTLITDLIYLNYQAAIFSKNAYTFSEALAYILKATTLFEKAPSPPQNIYPKLLLEKAICHGQLGDYLESEKTFKLILSNHIKSHPPYIVYPHFLRMLQRSEQLEKIQKIGIQALKTFGINIPRTTYGLTIGIIIQLTKIKWEMLFLPIDKIPMLPHLSDEKKSALSQILELVSEAFYINNNELGFAYTLFQMVTISIKYGNSEHSNMAWTSYGFVALKQGHYHKALAISKAALSLNDMFKTSNTAGRTSFLSYSHFTPWLYPFSDSLPELRKAYTRCLEDGDYWFSAACIYFIIFLRFFSGTPLEDILEEFESFDPFFKEHNIASYPSFQAYHEIITALTDQKKSLSTLTLPINQYEKQFKNEFTPYAFVMTFSMISYFTANKYKEAISLGQKISGLERNMKGIIVESAYWFYYALSHYELALKTKKKPPARICKKAHQKFKKWQTLCPENYKHQYLILKALYAENKGNPHRAIQYLTEALQLTQDQHHYHHEALINEKLFRIFQSLGLKTTASTYLNEAYSRYQKWGASSKLLQLHETSQPLLRFQLGQDNKTYLSQNIDTLSLIRSSQTISSEIVLEKLLDKLMKIAIENAGAQRGVLLLNRNGDLFVEIEKKVDQMKIEHFKNTSLNNYKALPKSIIETIRQSQKAIMIRDASTHTTYLTDPYTLETKARSILCLPIQKLSELIGILYLENNLAPDTFTENHIQLLTLLASQAAISIENAILYKENQDLIHNLETRVEEQVEEIKTATELEQKSRETAEKLAQQTAFSGLTRGIAHEIRNPMGMMLSSSELIVDNLDDKTAMSQYAYIIKSNIMRLTKVTNTMLRYGGKINADKTSGIVTDIINDILLAAKAECKNKGIHLTKQLEKTPEIPMDPNSISQAILNILLNAIQSMPTGGELHVETSLENFTNLLGKETSGIKIYITDTGCGIPKENMSKLFDPFFSTKYENSGLGLAIVQRTIFEHNGTIEITSERDTGTQVTVYLPTR